MMKIKSKIDPVYILLLLLTGCANPINERTATDYYDAGIQAEESGDLVLARECYYRAHQNAVMGNLGARGEAYALYEWSRISGYLCKIEESQNGFERTLKIIEENPSEVGQLLAPCLSELSRLLYDTGNHSEAVEVFPKAIRELEKENIVELDPIGFAAFLEDYEDSLLKSGLFELAGDVSKRAQNLKEQYPNRNPNFAPKRYCR